MTKKLTEEGTTLQLEILCDNNKSTNNKINFYIKNVKYFLINK